MWKYVMAAFYVTAGVGHFVMPGWYLKFMPDYLPWHLELIYVSGVIEIALGVLLCFGRTTTLAARGVILLLIAVFPAHIESVRHPEKFPDVPEVVFWLRMPVQLLLMWWAYQYTHPLGATGDSKVA